MLRFRWTDHRSSRSAFKRYHRDRQEVCIRAGINVSSNLPSRDFSGATRITVAGRVYPFRGVLEASLCYRQAIETLNLGASETPPCVIQDERGEQVGYVSYNGRVWACAGGFPNDVLIFDPYERSGAPVR